LAQLAKRQRPLQQLDYALRLTVTQMGKVCEHPNRCRTARVVVTLFGEKERLARCDLRLVQLALRQKQRAAILLDDGLRGHVTNLDRKLQCARQQLVGAVERALSRVQQAEVVEHPKDRIVLLLLLERAER